MSDYTLKKLLALPVGASVFVPTTRALSGPPAIRRKYVVTDYGVLKRSWTLPRDESEDEYMPMEDAARIGRLSVSYDLQ